MNCFNLLFTECTRCNNRLAFLKIWNLGIVTVMLWLFWCGIFLIKCSSCYNWRGYIDCRWSILNRWDSEWNITCFKKVYYFPSKCIILKVNSRTVTFKCQVIKRELKSPPETMKAVLFWSAKIECWKPENTNAKGSINLAIKSAGNFSVRYFFIGKSIWCGLLCLRYLI